MKKLLAFLMAMTMLLCSAALAEVQVESRPLEDMIFFSRATGYYYQRVDGGYQLFDADGNPLTAGNVVIPFIFRSNPEISDDSTVIYGSLADYSYVIYHLTFEDGSVTVQEQPAATPAPAAGDAWTCSCGTVATGKFCPECGTKF